METSVLLSALNDSYNNWAVFGQYYFTVANLNRLNNFKNFESNDA